MQSRSTVWKDVQRNTVNLSERQIHETSNIRDRHAKLDRIIQDLLIELELPEICWTSFEAENIDVESLAALTDGDLQAMGVLRLGDRRKLVQRAKVLLAGRELNGADQADLHHPSVEQAVHGDTKQTTGTSPLFPDESVQRSVDESGKPTNGWGEWEEDEGVYRGEWVNGKQHGKGTFVWRSGVRYDGEWYAGKPQGRGEWCYNRAGGGTGGRDKVTLDGYKDKNWEEGATREPEATAYDVSMSPDGLPASMDDQDNSVRFARVTRMKAAKSEADLERLSRGVQLWWPVKATPSSIQQKNLLAKEFFERVLAQDSQVTTMSHTCAPMFFFVNVFVCAVVCGCVHMCVFAYTHEDAYILAY
jgi:hypothetical protein